MEPRSETSRRGLVAAEKAGRGGDRALGHLTPGELVVPLSCQTHELMALFARIAHQRGLNPNRFIVGSEEASRNPKTGLQEFDDGDGESEGGGPGGDPGAEGGGFGDVSSDNSPPGGARDTPGTGDPDNSNTESGRSTNGEGPGTSGALGYGGFVDGLANVGEQAVDAVSGMFDAPSGRSLGFVGTALGMVPGVGLAMTGTRALEAITGEKGVADYGDGMGGGGGRSGVDQSDSFEITPIRARARRGLLPSRRAG